MSGRWLSDTVLDLPGELRPAKFNADALDEAAQQRAARDVAAMKGEDD